MSNSEIIPSEFIAAWQGKTKAQVLVELASLSQESNRKIDRYLFAADKDGDLVSPETQTKVAAIIKRDNPIGKLEGIAFDRINDWFKGNNEGVVAWLSPPDPVFYPGSTSKIIISEIQSLEGSKNLINRAVLIDNTDQQRCLELARGLSERSQNRPLLNSIEDVRSNVIHLGRSWLPLLEEFIDQPKMWEMIKSGYDLDSQQRALIKAEQYYPMVVNQNIDLNQLKASGVLGSYVSSCPVLMPAFGVFLSHSLVFGECKKIACGNMGCGWEAEGVDVGKIKRGEMTACPKCGWRPGSSQYLYDS